MGLATLCRKYPLQQRTFSALVPSRTAQRNGNPSFSISSGANLAVLPYFDVDQFGELASFPCNELSRPHELTCRGHLSWTRAIPRQSLDWC